MNCVQISLQGQPIPSSLVCWRDSLLLVDFHWNHMCCHYDDEKHIIFCSLEQCICTPSTLHSHPNECQASKGELRLFLLLAFLSKVLNEVSISLKCNKLHVWPCRNYSTQIRFKECCGSWVMFIRQCSTKTLRKLTLKALISFKWNWRTNWCEAFWAKLGQTNLTEVHLGH